MAPDADKLRLRKPELGVSPDGSNLHGSSDENDDGAATVERIATLKGLRGNEVCIDGVIYDITSFEHPGGDSIRLFGGNDVTTQYKMIHPYHTSKHLEKMKAVGRVNDYVSEYKWDTPFEREIKKEVFKIVNRGKEFGTTGYFIRALVYVAVFLYLQWQWMQQTSYSLAVIYGVSMALIGLNVQHDANHGAASRKVWINDLLGLGADMIGGCKWLWMEKHWTVRSSPRLSNKDKTTKPMLTIFLWLPT
ncbi:MAG: hypothetical protein SGILL_000948, partial [Bacillariaceae sp.]